MAYCKQSTQKKGTVVDYTAFGYFTNTKTRLFEYIENFTTKKWKNEKC